MANNEVTKESGVEWIGAIPQYWRKDKIFRLAEFISSGGTPRSTNEDFYGGDIMWVQTGDLNNNFIYQSSKQITLEGLRNSSAKIFPKNTLLIAMYGATIGKLGILAAEATTNQACCAIFVSAKMDIKFTFYMFMTMKDYLVFQSYGGGQPNISQEIIKQQYIFYPPFPEQQAIARYLEQRCGKLDAIIAIKRQQIKTLDALRQSIIYQAVTKGLDDSVPLVDSGVEWLGKIPLGWKIVRLKSIADIRYGLGQPPATKEDGIPIIRATDINSGKISAEKLMYIDPDTLPLSRNPYLKEGEIIVVRSGAYTGDSAIVPLEYEGAVAGYDMVVTVKKAVSKFISYSLLSSYVLKAQLLLLTLRAAQPHLNAQELGDILLVIPKNHMEQQRIVAHLDHEIQRLNELKVNLSQQISTLEAYKKSLIYECVTGKKRIKTDVLEAELALA